jgi:hypothetical protein
MSNYGRNFYFLVPPTGGQRAGRYYLAGETDLPIGAPVLVDASGDEDDLGLLPVELAAADDSRPKSGMGGILVYEHGPAAFAGYDANLTTYSDLSTVPAGKAVQVISGDTVKVALVNTEARTFLNTREYAARTMVAGAGATPTLAVGDYLTPGTGTDGAGYWKETSTEGDAWLVVTKVDTDRGVVEARLLF